MRKFGIEIEANGMSYNEVAALLNANGIECLTEGSHNARATRDAWMAKTDGSLGSYATSFELVSPPLSGEEGLTVVKKVCALLNDAGCDVNSKCGLHVHVDCNDLSAQHIANVYNRYLENERAFDDLMPTSRRSNNNTYCRSLTTDGRLEARRDAASTCSSRGDRYRKVNLCSFAKFGTIEFRQHSGTTCGAKIANWVRLLLAFVEASRPEGTATVVENVVDRVPSASIVQLLSLRGKQARLVQLLETNPSMSADALALALASTVASVQSMICRINRGTTTHIGSRYNRQLGLRVYHVNRTFSEVTRQVTRVVEGGSLKPMWHGVDANVVAYYRRRQVTLAA